MWQLDGEFDICYWISTFLKCEDLISFGLVGYPETNFAIKRNIRIKRPEKICKKLAKKGKLELLKYAIKNNCLYNNLTVFYAIKNNHLDCFKFLIEIKCPYDNCIFTYIIKHSQLKYLKILFKHNNYGPDLLSIDTIKYKRLDILKFLLKHNRYFNSWSLEAAIAYGYIDYLKLLLDYDKNPYSKNKDLTRYAIKCNQSDCLKLLIEYGYPI